MNSKETDPVSVRQARMEAKKLAKSSEYTHQQALDQVARGHGHRNWSALLAASTDGESSRNGMPVEARRRRPTDRMIDEEIETTFLEDAAELKHDWSRMPMWMTPVIGGIYWLTTLQLPMVRPTASAVLIATYLVATIGAGLVARHSVRDLSGLRRSIPGWGLVAGSASLVLSLLMGAYGLYHYGRFDALGPSFYHPIFDNAALAYMIGTTIIVTTGRMHRAMTVAAPDSVRPSEARIVIPVEPRRQPNPNVMSALAFGMFGGVGLAVLGVVGLIGCAGYVVATGGLSMSTMGWSVGVMMVGIFLAMVCMMTISAFDRSTREVEFGGMQRRASRARRLVKAGRRSTSAA